MGNSNQAIFSPDAKEWGDGAMRLMEMEEGGLRGLLVLGT